MNTTTQTVTLVKEYARYSVALTVNGTCTHIGRVPASVASLMMRDMAQHNLIAQRVA
jgi:hypothetical protein